MFRYCFSISVSNVLLVQEAYTLQAPWFLGGFLAITLQTIKCGIWFSGGKYIHIKNYFLVKYQHIFKTERCREEKEIVTRGSKVDFTPNSQCLNHWESNYDCEENCYFDAGSKTAECLILCIFFMIL